MPYWIALVPVAAFVGVVGAVVSVVRGGWRSALIFAGIGAASIVFAIVGYYASL